MAVEKLTAAKLQYLKHPASGFNELWDESCRGLCLRVFASGKATWTFRYRPQDGGTRRRIKLGEYPSVGLSEARKRADKQRGKVADGTDPQGEINIKRKAPTLGEVINRYLAEFVEPMKKGSTAALYRHYLQNLVTAELKVKRVGVVTHSDVVALHRNIGADRPATANRVIVTLQGVYTFAGRNGLVVDRHNPAQDIKKFKEEPKDRYLTTDELTRLGNVMRTAVTEGLPWPEKEVVNPSKHRRKQENQKTVLDVYVAAAVYLLIFTGCRLREILDLEWSMVDAGRGMLFLPDSKTGKKAVVLNAPAMAILQGLEPLGRYVIPGDPGPNGEDRPRADLKRPWELIKHHAGLEGVRIHDLRHTHASIGAGDGLGLPIIGKLLGHKNVTTTARYAHLDVDPVRRASNHIGERLAAAMQIWEQACMTFAACQRWTNVVWPMPSFSAYSR